MRQNRNSSDWLKKKKRKKVMDQKRRQNKHSQPNVAGRQRHASLTFLGGRIASADLGVIET
jgi:hypothetical protein